MDPRTLFRRHPFAVMVTAVFVYALVVTTLYFLGLIPGVRKTDLEFSTLITITVILLVATAVSWITAFALSSDGR